MSFFAAGQCCGAGNPVSSSGSETSLRKGSLQMALEYRHSESNDYFEGSHKADIEFPGKISSSGYDYMSLGASYGITSCLTAQLILGYFIDKYEKYCSDLFPDVSVSGVGDLSVSANYSVFRSVRKGYTVNTYLMVKFPIGKFDCESEGVKLPISMQPSSGSYKYSAGIFASYSPVKKITLITNDFWEYAQRIKSRNFDYKYGNTFYTSLGARLRFVNLLYLGVHISHEYKGRARSDGKPLYGSAFQQLKLSPTIGFIPFKQFGLSLTGDFPVWRKVEGIQMANSWALELKMTYNIKL